jgi:prepilin-type N-terminal cleavage/methylation domain-containing protein/prepilin-type processing-associated H-X9-DG protein
MRKAGYLILDARYSKSNIRKNGFTIVELLVVIAIIAAVMAMLLPGLGKARAMAYRLRCATNLKQIDLAFQAYMDNNNDIYPCSNDPNHYVLWPGRNWRPFVAPYLGGNIDGNNPSVLWCQKDLYSKLNYDSTSYAYSMSSYQSPEKIDTLVYTAQHDEQFLNMPPIPQRRTSVTKPSGKIIIGEWFSNHFLVNEDSRWWCRGWWSWAGKRNYLFADSHVRFLDTNDIRPALDGNPNPNVTIHGIRGIDWPR